VTLGVSACSNADSKKQAQREDMPFIRDDQGRALILHGINVASSAKNDPQRIPVFTRDDALRLSKDWGFNFVRYLILWDAVEPEPGEINQAYFDLVQERLDWFHEAGILVVIDMHQDVYAARFCCDGAPEWAIIDDGEPFEMQGAWYQNYFQPAVQRAFDNFWDYEGPHPELQDHYAGAWEAVARRFKDHPAVIGYDIMNEPHPGSMMDLTELIGIENPDAGPSPVFDTTRLQPFYQRMINRIRQVDNDNWIFYEPRYGAPGNGFKSYLGVLEDPRPGENRIAYFPHLYSIRLEAKEEYDPSVDTSVFEWEQRREEEKLAQNAPLLLGEWGLNPSFDNARLFMRHVVEMSDRSLAGWAYWSWDPGGWSIVNPDLTERETANDLVRVYPQRIAGKPDSFIYVADTHEFILAFYDSPGISGPMEIYIPKSRFYPCGYTVNVGDPQGSWSMQWNEETEILSVTTPYTDTMHTIEILPKTGC